MDNNVSQEKKNSILKSLAIIGFIGLIILIAWLSVKLVAVAPSAFSSLASLAESVNERQSSLGEKDDKKEMVTFTVVSNTTLLNSGESTDLSWDKANVRGSYTFSYQCAEGVAVDILNVEGIKSIECDTNYNIGENNNLSVMVDSEKNRYADLNYTIAFLRTNETSPSAKGESTITIVNSTIAEVAKEDTEVKPVTISEEKTEEVTKVEETKPTVVTTPTQKPEVTKPVVTTPTPTYKQEYVYTIPTSDPNGKTDLSASFINIGRITGNTFFAGTVKQDDKGAIQFEVKNYGTKTSANWTYTVSLPDGDTYTSSTQTPLKPNEQAIITVGFPTNDKSTHTFKIEVKESTDKNLLNNKFSKVVNFVK